MVISHREPTAQEHVQTTRRHYRRTCLPFRIGEAHQPLDTINLNPLVAAMSSSVARRSTSSRTTRCILATTKMAAPVAGNGQSASTHRLRVLLPGDDLAGCSNKNRLVELRGFEPLASSLRTKRATNCATAPGCRGGALRPRNSNTRRLGSETRGWRHTDCRPLEAAAPAEVRVSAPRISRLRLGGSRVLLRAPRRAPGRSGAASGSGSAVRADEKTSGPDRLIVRTVRSGAFSFMHVRRQRDRHRVPQALCERGFAARPLRGLVRRELHLDRHLVVG